MIDKKDRKTIEAFPKRGRPSTGKALTPAERKKQQRERAKKTIWSSDIPDYSQIPTAMLLESLSFAVSTGAPNIAKAITREIIKRAKANEPQEA